MAISAHANGLIDHDAVMFLMPLLPALLVTTIVIAAWLDKRATWARDNRAVGLL